MCKTRTASQSERSEGTEKAIHTFQMKKIILICKMIKNKCEICKPLHNRSETFKQQLTKLVIH